MKIGIIGTHCSGKTSLIDKLYSKCQFANYNFLEEPIREVSRAGFKVNKESDNASQLAMLACHLRNLEHENFISDRTILDLYVYATTIPSVSKDVKDFIYKQLMENIDRYDYLFWCAPEFDMNADGFRETDVQWQQQVERSFAAGVEVLNKRKLKKSVKIIRLTGETPERAERVMQEVFNEQKDVCKK